MDMTKVMIAVLLGSGALLLPARADEATSRISKQTILFIRHGEKPAAGLGQLNCKGLNRALALPAVLAARYGQIDAVYAPDPAKQKPDGNVDYDYVRPLATVEPTAIGLGLPIHADFGYDEIGKLRSALLSPDYRDKTILVGWEHNKLSELVPTMVSALGGDAKPMPWDKADFDSIWRVTIEWSDGKVHATLDAEKEGLDGLPETCPR